MRQQSLGYIVVTADATGVMYIGGNKDHIGPMLCDLHEGTMRVTVATDTVSNRTSCVESAIGGSGNDAAPPRGI